MASKIEKAQYWLSPVPDSCQMCDGEFHSHHGARLMYAARARTGGWGNFCHTCFTRYQMRLGLGSGQRYTQQANGRWLKTGG